VEYRGRYIQGDAVQLSVLTRDNARLPTVPDTAPVAAVCLGSEQVATFRLPIVDRFAQRGYFSLPLVLDARFVAGSYRVVYQWLLSGVMYSAAESFEVVAGGQGDGAGLAMFYLHRPASDWVLLQTDGGRMIRRRNPRTA
jgi:hypothetical protein